MQNNKDKHECPLRNKVIKDGECFETVMAILQMHSVELRKKLYKLYPNCEEICKKCQYNKEK